MAITYKGERTVAELNNNLGGFVKDSAFRIYDHGILLKGNVPVKHGDFVSWTGTRWKIEPSLEYATSADVEAIEEQVESLGNPLQWKGPATVSELNTGISGIQAGWTYTLTDAGTLTDGSVKVDAGDEVAWTGTAWFKVGGDGGVKVLHGSSNPGGTTYPDAEDVVNAVAQGKEVVIFWNSSGNLFVYRLEYMLGYAASGDDSYVFRCIEDYNQTKILSQTEGTYTWSWEIDNKIPYPSSIAEQYSDQSTYAEGDYCMYRGQLHVCTTAILVAEAWDDSHWQRTSMSAIVGNVETLLAAL